MGKFHGNSKWDFDGMLLGVVVDVNGILMDTYEDY